MSSGLWAKTKCIAHRGYHKQFTENSIDAIKHAFRVGSQGVEFDIVHTKDEEPILMHDLSLERTTRNRWKRECSDEKISSLTLKEIQDNCMLKDGQTIPRLKEALLLTEGSDDSYFFIELKDKPTAVTEELIHSRFFNQPERVRIISFHLDYLNHLKSLNLVHSEFWKNVKFMKLSSKYWGWEDLKEFAIDVYVKAYQWKKTYFINESRQGREVSVWTVNKKEHIQDLVKDKIDFITTDQAQSCVSLL